MVWRWQRKLLGEKGNLFIKNVKKNDIEPNEKKS
jgi:hypothetical protein